jgi:hypothetical protein
MAICRNSRVVSEEVDQVDAEAKVAEEVLEALADVVAAGAMEAKVVEEVREVQEARVEVPVDDHVLCDDDGVHNDLPYISLLMQIYNHFN